MTCKDCPHHIADSNTCCHQSIKPIAQRVVPEPMCEEILERMKAQYDEAYEYYGNCYDD